MSDKSTDSFPILIVEDHPVSRQLLEKSLTRAGYQVATVRNGYEALDTFEKSFFPVVITDWAMPHMDGLQLCRAIRGLAASGYIYIIFLTAKDSKDDIIAGLEAGADDYLTKPFSYNELVARLKTGQRILALERSLKTANEEIKTLSITDPLTKSLNRGYAMNRVPEEISRTTRYGHPLSLIMFDLDHFKDVNDSHGHLAGDAVLKEVVDCVKAEIRQGIDWVARYGGEEFFVVCPETDRDGALVVAERLRSKVAENVIRTQGQDITVTASFGVSCFDPTIDGKASPEELIRQADQCLYQAKNEGRNRVKATEQRARIYKRSPSRP